MTNRKYSTLLILALAGFALAAPHKISAGKAAKIALAKYHGKLMKTPRLEKEDGIWQYEVFVKVGKLTKEVNVNADTGKIGSVENISAAEEAREKKADAKKAGMKKKETEKEGDEKGEKME